MYILLKALAFVDSFAEKINANFFIFSNIYVLFCSKVMSGQLNIYLYSCALTGSPVYQLGKLLLDESTSANQH